ncbi:MAG: PIG-L deacetylase family protein [Streptosporangiaceae bacterium]
MVAGHPPNLIDRPGTTEDAWRSWPGLRRLPAAYPLAWRSAVVIAAHPDDEVLGAGGMMAMLAAAGARLRLIAVTDGEASHPGTDSDVIARTRIAESAAALDLLGAGDAEVIRLGFADTGVADREEELSAVLPELCAGFGACLAPWEADGHADHEAAARAARRAVPDVLAYPVWMWHWATPGDPRVPWQRARRVALPAYAAARKRAAIAAFASQLADREGGLPPILPAGVMAHFTRRQEVLLR